MDYQTNYQFGTQISQVFAKNIEPLLRGKKVIDLGCGQGDYLQFFGLKSLGMDLSPVNLKAAKKRGLRAQPMDFNRPILPGEKFEVVFASHVLEHVESPVDFLRFANKCLITQGQIVIAVPNEQSLIHWRYPYFTRNGNHLYSFSVDNLKELLLYTGFTPTTIYYDFYTTMTTRLKLNPVLSIFDYAPNTIKNYLAWAFWIVAKRKD